LLLHRRHLTTDHLLMHCRSAVELAAHDWRAAQDSNPDLLVRRLWFIDAVSCWAESFWSKNLIGIGCLCLLGYRGM
jgi:hypothetical protein